MLKIDIKSTAEIPTTPAVMLGILIPSSRIILGFVELAF